MKSHAYLRSQMTLHGITQGDIAARWGRKRPYVSRKFNGHSEFDIQEAYDLCELLEIPIEKIKDFFPQKSVKEWRKKHVPISQSH